MKHKAHGIRNGLLGGLAALLIVFFLIAGWYGIKGYRMYRQAVAEAPIAELGESLRENENFTYYDELPPLYVEAVIAAEDKRFESHHGIDILAIGRAIWTDLTTLSFAEGGSTITQQIAKNQLFTQEKRIERKVAEVFAAFALEKQYSKKELFEIYVNTIYFGSGYYGIYEAAQGYFGKQPSELTAYEAIMLAGLPNAPSLYSPDENQELAQQRMKVVLDCMIKSGKVTQQEAATILEMPKRQAAFE
ncbi:MAG: transglycosylase domain-containing protein [Lachnospiraceae bacterium]|jgi:monofunctional glycosyltransferase|nr:transglycosylase domain-containing protein [Lachnospiraceae bacterium]